MAILKKKKILKVSAKKVVKAKKILGKKKIVRVAKKPLAKRVIKKKIMSGLQRALHNPIIEPSLYSWESKATFNPAAFALNGKVHIVYRAIGGDDSSALGYAMSDDGYNITERFPYSIYRRSNNFHRPDFTASPIDYVSGGGWNGGCEDPRLTVLEGMVYMLYTAFDGWGSVRIALTSITLADFNKRKWNWKNPVLISPPNQINKNWALFPEKINGKFAILHSISPKILVDYVESLDEFDGKKFIKSNYNSKPEWRNSWDSSVRGIGPSPIKTDLGWLVLYHAMDRKDPDRYKLGAMILDIKNPSMILYHSENPILEPDARYENEGYKWGVVYSCGAVVKGGTLFVYYGGADKVIGVATIILADLLEHLKSNKIITLGKQATNNI